MLPLEYEISELKATQNLQLHCDDKEGEPLDHQGAQISCLYVVNWHILADMNRWGLDLPRNREPKYSFQPLRAIEGRARNLHDQLQQDIGEQVR